MRDEMDGRLWAAHGPQFTNDLHALLVSAGKAIVQLHRASWAAQWHGARPMRSRLGQA